MKKLFIPFSLSLFLLSQGCVDNQYDGDIDMNVQLAGNGLSAPIGETSKFTLNDLIGEDDNLKTGSDGAYYIYQDSESDVEFSTMEPFDITEGLKPEIKPTGLEIPPALKDAVAGGYGWSGPIPNVEIDNTADLKPEGIDVPDELRHIDTIYFTEPKNATLTFRVDLFEEVGDGNSFDLSLSDLEGDLPKMLILTKTGSDKGATTLETSDGKEVVVKQHHFTISDTTIAKGGVFTLEIPIYGICGREYFNINIVNGEWELEIVGNSFRVTGTADIDVNLPNEGPKRAQLLSDPVIATEFEIDHLTISHVYGEVDASANENFSIEIGSMPDFLNDDSVKLDFYPYIKLLAINPMGVPVEASLTITPQTENESKPIEAKINMEAATYNEDSKLMDKKLCNFFLSDSVRKPEPKYFGDQPILWKDTKDSTTFLVADTLYTWVRTPLSSLLDNGVPESLDVAIEANSYMVPGKLHEIVLSNDPDSVKVNCYMTVPMEFGDSLRIKYSEIEDGLEDIFESFSLKEAKINIDYTTTLPLNLEISLEGLQEIPAEEFVENNPDYIKYEDEDEDEPRYYKVLRDIGVGILKENGLPGGIINGAAEGTISTGKVIASLVEMKPDAMKKLTAVRYTLTGNPAGASGTLRDSQYVQLTLSATIKNIEVDIDSL